MVVNEVFYSRLGSPALANNPTVSLIGQQNTTAVIVGVYPSSQWDSEPGMYLLTDAMQAITPAVAPAPPSGGGVALGGMGMSYGMGQQPPMYEAWVPPELSTQFEKLLQRDIQGGLGRTRVST